MMPCQEPPVAMATWQATVAVPKGYTVLSSGDIVHCKTDVLKNTIDGKGFKILLLFVNLRIVMFFIITLFR